MKHKGELIVLFVAVPLALFMMPSFGSRFISPFVADSQAVLHTIFWSIRFPRAVVAVFGGAVLAVAGSVFQSLFRNDLASPYTLGVSGGAGVGASLAILLGFPWFMQPVAAFVGAVIPIMLIYGFVSGTGRTTPSFLILAGVAMQITAGGIILFLHYMADRSQSAHMMRWVMGSLDVVSYRPGVVAAGVYAVLAAVLLFYHRELDLLSLGHSVSHTRGVNVSRTVSVLFVTISVGVALLISFVGPIGFVGLIAPHIARRRFGSEHSILIFSSAAVGALLLLISDTIARTVVFPGQIPVGVITALAGGPFFLWILYRSSAKKID